MRNRQLHGAVAATCQNRERHEEWTLDVGGAADHGEPVNILALQEVGHRVEAQFEPLSPCRLPGGKTVHAWLAQADLDLSDLRSNLFEMEWPPHSGRMQSFPEVDQAAYVAPDAARLKIHRGQRPIIEEAILRLTSPA